MTLPLRTIGVCTVLAIAILVNCQAKPEKERRGVVDIEQPSSPISPTEIQRIAQTYHDAGIFDGVIAVATSDGLVYEGGFGVANREFGVSHSPDSRVRIASLSKMTTAVIVLRLVEEGVLSFDHTVGELLPELSNRPFSDVRLDQLLSHRSGIPNYQYKDAYRDLQTRVLTSGMTSPPVTTADMIETFVDLPMLQTDEGEYSYSNANYVLLQAIIERQTDGTFEEALSTYVTGRLALANTGIAGFRLSVDRLAEGYTYGPVGPERPLQAQYIGVAAPGGFYSTASDMTTFLSALMSGNLFENSTTLDAMLEPRSTAYNNKSFVGFGLFRSSIDIEGESVLMIGHDGWGPPYTANIQYVPSLNMSFFAGDTISGPGGATYGETVRLIEDLVRAAYGDQVEPPETPLNLSLLNSIQSKGVNAALSDLRNRIDAEDLPERLEVDVNRLGHVYLEAGEPGIAADLFELSAEYFPESIYVWDGLGQAYRALGRNADAKAAYETGLTLDPESEHFRSVLDSF
jgi:CubicO group peptidase (beta-lactamase class C family)